MNQSERHGLRENETNEELFAERTLEGTPIVQQGIGKERKLNRKRNAIHQGERARRMVSGRAGCREDRVRTSGIRA